MDNSNSNEDISYNVMNYIPAFHNHKLSLTLSEVPSEVIIKSRIKYGSRRSACKGLLLDYMKSSTIHGLRYLSEVHRPVYEKFVWLAILIVSVYFAISLIHDTYIKWLDTPVILGFDETLVPVHNIPFPTVTICPESKTNTDLFSFKNISHQIWEEIEKHKTFENRANLTDDDLERFASILHICETDVVNRFAPYLPKQSTKPNVANTLRDITLSKNETNPFCRWNNQFYLCEVILTYVATDEGICYQFNGLQPKDIYRDAGFLNYHDDDEIDFHNVWGGAAKPMNNLTGNWSLDDGYVDQGYNAYPQRTIFSSARHGLFVFMMGFNKYLDYSCRQFTQGYKVFLNSPESVPLTTGNYILVPHGFEVMVSVLPNYIMSDDNLHSFKPEKRQCYFNDERHLRYFQHYSQSNCQTECLTNYTISKCGCAKFWMPKPFDIGVCGISDIDCYNEAEKELNLILQNETMHSNDNQNGKLMCDCMPSCTSLDYNVEISLTRFNLFKMLSAYREAEEFTNYAGSRLSVYFKEHQFTAIKRTVLFSTTTMIANWGGILGLFMGISSLSVVELIYFFSVRLIHNLRRRRLIKKQLMAQELDDENNINRDIIEVDRDISITH